MHTNKDITMPPIPLLIIIGPTASGKSALAVEIARKLKGEVISADSRQVYTGLDIGTGKITRGEMHGVPHHLLDIADPRVPANSPRHFTVEKWRTAAERAIEDIHARGKLPIICGGTGFYISALVDGLTFPDVPPDKRLRERLSKMSADQLFKKLKKLDPRRASMMQRTGQPDGKYERKDKGRDKGKDKGKENGDAKNPRRLIRAIEIALKIGRVPPLEGRSVSNMDSKHPSPKYAPIFIGISLPPEVLKKRIEKRLKSRLKQGMIEEIKTLHAPAPKGIGLSWKRMYELGLEYRYIASYLRGKRVTENREGAENRKDTEQMTAALATAIWHYAKRQMTWWKRDRRIRWLSPKQALRVGLTSKLNKHG